MTKLGLNPSYYDAIREFCNLSVAESDILCQKVYWPTTQSRSATIKDGKSIFSFINHDDLYHQYPNSTGQLCY
jgi:hypothetical protein